MAVTPVRDQITYTYYDKADPEIVAVQILRRFTGEAPGRRERVPRRGMPTVSTANRALLIYYSPGTLLASSPDPRASLLVAPMA